LEQQTVVWRIGETIQVGGGEISRIDEQMRSRVPAKCRGPYWIVGGLVIPPTATMPPK
jgi:hypothetical protein